MAGGGHFENFKCPYKPISAAGHGGIDKKVMHEGAGQPQIIAWRQRNLFIFWGWREQILAAAYTDGRLS